MIKWEIIKDNKIFKPDSYDNHGIYRAKVPGGWLIMLSNGNVHKVLTFYPDPKHDWDGSSLE